ncbi:MAG: hypothetical protein HY819_10690 [Acidobacteria bacterium]|nr:hypothetical protein [Acidobacteriota bacterium]
MLESVILALAFTSPYYLTRKEESKAIVVVGRESSSTTERYTSSLSLADLQINSTATCWSDLFESDMPFISPVKNLEEVNVSYLIGGKIEPLPIDEYDSINDSDMDTHPIPLKHLKEINVSYLIGGKIEPLPIDE